MQLYHGSKNIIEKPIYAFGKTTNDYGQGFYCTKEIALAKEWACAEQENGYANEYELNTKGLTMMDFSAEEYSAMNWLAVLINNRKLSLTSPIMKAGREYILENFLVDISACDLIKGYRADDSYFQFVRAFLSNTISYEQLKEALVLGKLGEQYTLKSERAFKRIKFVAAHPAETAIYFPQKIGRNRQAEKEYAKILEKSGFGGLRLSTIIEEGISNEDPRIR